MSDKNLPKIVPATATPDAPSPAPQAGTPAPGVRMVPQMPPEVAALNLKRHTFQPKDGVRRVTAAAGVPGTTGELPSFLQGPDAAVRAVRHQAEVARGELAQLLTTLQTRLPGAAAALKAVEDAQDGPGIAAAEGFDVAAARSLVDNLTRLLQALK